MLFRSAACGGASAGSDDAVTPQSVTIMLSEFAISPAQVSVPAGTPIDFSVMNMGAATHTLAVETPDGTLASGDIAAGATGSLSVPALDAGTYRIVCTVPGHSDLGMKATQPGAKLLAHLRVERTERFVEQQHRRCDSECPRQRHALPLPARQL